MEPEGRLAPGSVLEHLPQRILLAARRRSLLDDLGFVLPLGKVFRAADLLRPGASLVVAPPWTGKTFLAEQLYRALRTSPALRYHLVGFESLGRGARVQPPWWDTWRQDDSQACWIIDAVDEDERLADRRVYEILDEIGGLGKERDRLCAIFFCRESEIPPLFEKRINEIFGKDLRQFRLAGLDRESARDLVGPDHFDRVCRQLEEGRLKELAALPVVLEHLKRKDSAEASGRKGVWRGVLIDLLRDSRGRARLSATAPEVDDRFEVVAWLAAVLTFSGKMPPLEALVPRELKVLREAAREAFLTAVFEPSEDGWRFAQDHVREWFAAFALEGKTLLQIRPLLTDAAGHPNPVHFGVMDILARITDQPEVRAWIEQSHGGIIPPSGAVPWTLTEIAHALDKLQELARVAPWGLSLWREDRFAQWNAPEVGQEIARRLEGRLAIEEQEVLLDIALAINAREPIGPAIRILRDETKNDRLRALASVLVARSGEREQLERLERWVHALRYAEAGEVILPLISGFFHKGIWTFETTAEFALTWPDPGSVLLQTDLAVELTTTTARAIVAKALNKTSLLGELLVSRALTKLLSQDRLTEIDEDLLLPLALRQEEIDEGRRYGLPNVAKAFARDENSRRKLFLAGICQDPDRRRKGWWNWRNVLQAGDLDWLLDVIAQRGGEPSWLWETVYFLAYLRDAPLSVVRRVRASIRVHDRELLRRLDQERKDWKRGESRSVEPQTSELLPLVRETLADSSLDLHGKMLRFSWSCFSRANARPARVRGEWRDLDEETRRAVLSICWTALLACSPTPIPEGQGFPTEIAWEAACFSVLLDEDPGLALNSELIGKWLPAVLRAQEGEWKPLLRRSLEVDRAGTEKLIVEAILREIRSHLGPHLAQALSSDLWSEHLVSLLESAVVEDSTAPVTARVDLLIRIGRVYPGRAAAVAKRWADDFSAPQLQEHGVDLLLAVDPRAGWSRLEVLMRQEEPAAVLPRMKALLPRHSGPKADFGVWPANLLGQLAACLYNTFPKDRDPEILPSRAYSFDSEDDLRSLKDTIPALLYRRQQEGDAEALDGLARKYAPVRLWLEQTRAQTEADGVLAGASSRGEVPMESIVRLLRDSRSRLIRTADDLLDLVLEELRVISREAKQHLAMLYRTTKGEGRRRLPEEALQAYLQCRLADRMTSGYLRPSPEILFLNRETLAAKNSRNDLKIEAASIDGKKLTLIIEVKWSDNPEISTGQVSQLGERYLLENAWTHGIYLVGWCGRAATWSSEALGTAPTSRAGLEAWQASLQEQASLFMQAHQDLVIRPFVMDLAWETRAAEDSVQPAQSA